MSPKEITKEEIQRIYETKTYFLNHLHQQWTVAQLARRSAMNTEKFRRGFYLIFEYQVQAFMTEARMRLGLFLLQHTKKTIKDIASRTGYRHYNNFLKAFKKHFGVTAQSVRRRKVL